MSLTRAEGAGLAVAAVGHAALFAALSLSLATPPPPPALPAAMAVTLTAGDALAEPAPAPPAPAQASAPAAPALAAPDSPAPEKSDPASAPPPTPTPAPAVSAPTPVKVRAPVPAATPTPRPAAPAAPRPGRLDRAIVAGLADAAAATGSSASSTGAPAAATSPAVEAAIARAVLRQLKPFWRAPTGPDAELLRTELSISLSRSGEVDNVRVIGTTGTTASNRVQVRLHQEAAVKAVRLAAPFDLPAEHYATWKRLEPVGFDRRLSR